MRISDWSSDVCLPISPRPDTQRLASSRSNARWRFCTLRRVSGGESNDADIPGSFPKQAESPHLGGGIETHDFSAWLEARWLLATAKIGSASCRERVCQYV